MLNAANISIYTINYKIHSLTKIRKDWGSGTNKNQICSATGIISTVTAWEATARIK